MLVSLYSILTVLIKTALAIPTNKSTPPSLQLDHGTFIGTSDGVVNKFLGIPFGKAPTGDLRFNLPVAVDPYNGTHNATEFGPACPQQSFTVPYLEGLPKEVVDYVVKILYNLVVPSAEDCLSLDVVVPAALPPDSKLPVVVWIYGGAFEYGGTNGYDGGVIVNRSIELNEPVIYVSMNYRGSAYGFLASQEVKDAGVGNLGLQDQRLAFRWIQKYISAFGGDPTKVTIWGVSSGAVSAALHLVANGGNTEGLFRGAFMQSGPPVPIGDITHGQSVYDGIVSATGCSGAQDTLQCLREVEFDTLKSAVDQTPGLFSYQSLRLTWVPRADGNFLTDGPLKLVQKGAVADVPFVIGDCDDEGTLFSLTNLNITTESELRTYIRTNYITGVSDSDLDRLFKLYPADVTQGSPFNTSTLNAVTPEFKRLAALQGDLVFQAPRRFFLQNVAGKQATWSFLNKRSKEFPILGSMHGSDIENVYGPGDMTDYLINFVNHLDPNGKTGIPWPQYSVASPQLLTFQDGPINLTITNDTYRANAFELITNLSLQFPI